MAENSESSVDEDTASSTESASPPKKVVSTKAMEPKPKSGHPSTAEMVVEAITKLEERGGSSLIAIRKYITETYKLDPERQNRFIKKYLKAAVESGTLIQTKGKGASGSFKLPSASAVAAAKRKAAKDAAAAANAEPAKKPTVKKPKKTESTESTSTAKKQASSKVTKKDSSATVKNAKTSKSAAPKSPKAKKTAKSPTTKPKAPKPKKVTAGAKSPKAAMSKKAVVAKK